MVPHTSALEAKGVRWQVKVQSGECSDLARSYFKIIKRIVDKLVWKVQYSILNMAKQNNEQTN